MVASLPVPTPLDKPLSGSTESPVAMLDTSILQEVLDTISPTGCVEGIVAGALGKREIPPEHKEKHRGGSATAEVERAMAVDHDFATTSPLTAERVPAGSNSPSSRRGRSGGPPALPSAHTAYRNHKRRRSPSSSPVDGTGIIVRADSSVRQHSDSIPATKRRR